MEILTSQKTIKRCIFQLQFILYHAILYKSFNALLPRKFHLSTIFNFLKFVPFSWHFIAAFFIQQLRNFFRALNQRGNLICNLALLINRYLSREAKKKITAANIQPYFEHLLATTVLLYRCITFVLNVIQRPV